jgi:hypothetical protein
MTEAAGLVLGVVALWKTCVQIFDAIDSGRRYGMDYELLRVKLEVERIRLLNWGDGNDSSEPNPRLKREEVKSAVTRVLGCIQHIFENSERLQNTYGLEADDRAASGYRFDRVRNSSFSERYSRSHTKA